MFSKKNRDAKSRGTSRTFASPDAETLARKEILSVKPARRLPSVSQWKHLPKFLSLSEKRVALGALTIALLAGTALGLRFLSAHQSLSPAVGGSYTEGLVGTPALINPLYASASDVDNDLAHLMYSGLMRFDPQDGLGTDLASSYTVSPDGKSYTFVLRDGVRFHNGDSFSSEDVAFTFRAIQNPEYGSTLAPTFAGVTIDTPDARTVTFTLPEASSAFLGNMTVGILPAGVWSDIPSMNAKLTILSLEPIGTGPYKFEKLTKDSRGTLRSMTLVRNKQYYRGVPFIDSLQFKFAGSADELANLLRNKNIEGAVTVPFSEAPKFTSDRSFQVLQPLIPQYTAAFFNLKSTGPIGDSNVRKGLDLGLDRQAVITKALVTKALPLNSPLVTGMPGANTTGAGSFDLAAADAALEASGYKKPEGGGTRVKGTTALTLNVAFANTTELNSVATELKRQWELLGASVNLEAKSADSLQTDILRNRNFDVLLTGELYGAFRDPYPYWHSSQSTYPGLNITQLVNRSADEAMSIIRSTTDETKRAESYAAFAKVLADQHVAAFLYEPSYVYLTSKSIKGVDLPVVNLPADRFADINEWYIKTKRVLKK
ncbi:MAG: peptide ABC transporter substrate-binding protein [Patescibacteria group bacterium]